MSNKVLRHPEREEIMERLLKGDSVKSVEKWLKSRHPKTKRLHISYMTLQEFRKEHLRLDGEILQDIKDSRNKLNQKEEEREESALLINSKAYQNKINEIVNRELDVTQKMLEMEKLISSRLEFYFNTIHNSESIGVKEEKLFLELIAAQRETLRDWKKYVEGVADKKIEHNININVVNEQITVLKNVVFEVLNELDPKLIPIFAEKVSSRLDGMNYGNDQYNRYQLGIIDAEETEL